MIAAESGRDPLWRRGSISASQAGQAEGNTNAALAKSQQPRPPLLPISDWGLQLCGWSSSTRCLAHGASNSAMPRLAICAATIWPQLRATEAARRLRV